MPDHQEVYSDEASDESITVEILNLAPGNNLEEAAAVHWSSLLKLNHAQAAKINEVAVCDPSDSLPGVVLPPGAASQPQLVLMMGHMAAPKFNEKALNSVDVFLAVVRLPQQDTDILLVLNSPTAVSPESSSAKSFDAPHPEGSLALFKSLVASFGIADWGLFP